MRKTMLLVLICSVMTIEWVAPLEARAGTSVAQLQALSDGIATIAAKVQPGVVAIFSEGTELVSVPDPFSGTPFERFFGVPHGQGEPPRQKRQRSGQGSGVIVAHKGECYILTNNHVIRGADQIQVQLADDRFLDAEVVGADSLSDVAVLSVDADDLPTVPLGTSADLRPGEMVLALGNPMGYEHSVTYGIVSALGRGRFNTEEYGSYIQTDAAINPGNSGGALVNLKGELIGINTAIVSHSGGYEGISFAIPVDLVRNVMEQIIEHGVVHRGFLGAMIADLGSIRAEYLGMENTRGVLIESVVADGPADRAGLKGLDVVLAVDGKAVRDVTEFRSRIGATAPGTRVKLRILRDGKKRDLEVELGELTGEALANSGGEQESQREDALGLQVQEITPELVRGLRLEDASGVIVAQVEPGSEAARRGIARRDVILEVNRQHVDGLSDYRQAMGAIKPGAVVLMLVRRGGNTRYVGLRMPTH